MSSEDDKVQVRLELDDAEFKQQVLNLRRFFEDTDRKDDSGRRPEPSVVIGRGGGVSGIKFRELERRISEVEKSHGLPAQFYELTVGRLQELFEEAFAKRPAWGGVKEEVKRRVIEALEAIKTQAGGPGIKYHELRETGFTSAASGMLQLYTVLMRMGKPERELGATTDISTAVATALKMVTGTYDVNIKQFEDIIKSRSSVTHAGLMRLMGRLLIKAGKIAEAEYTVKDPVTGKVLGRPDFMTIAQKLGIDIAGLLEIITGKFNVGKASQLENYLNILLKEGYSRMTGRGYPATMPQEMEFEDYLRGIINKRRQFMDETGKIIPPFVLSAVYLKGLGPAVKDIRSTILSRKGALEKEWKPGGLFFEMVEKELLEFKVVELPGSFTDYLLNAFRSGKLDLTDAKTVENIGMDYLADPYIDSRDKEKFIYAANPLLAEEASTAKEILKEMAKTLSRDKPRGVSMEKATSAVPVVMKKIAERVAKARDISPGDVTVRGDVYQFLGKEFGRGIIGDEMISSIALFLAGEDPSAKTIRRGARLIGAGERTGAVAGEISLGAEDVDLDESFARHSLLRLMSLEPFTRQVEFVEREREAIKRGASFLRTDIDIRELYRKQMKRVSKFFRGEEDFTAAIKARLRGETMEQITGEAEAARETLGRAFIGNIMGEESVDFVAGGFRDVEWEGMGYIELVEKVNRMKETMDNMGITDPGIQDEFKEQFRNIEQLMRQFEMSSTEIEPATLITAWWK